MVAPEREYWVETADRTFLYYKVTAGSKQEALEKFLRGDGKFVGCTDLCNERIHAVHEERPYVSWR